MNNERIVTPSTRLLKRASDGTTCSDTGGGDPVGEHAESHVTDINYGALEQQANGEDTNDTERPTIRERASSIAETFIEEIQEAAEVIVDGAEALVEGVTEVFFVGEAAEVADAFAEEFRDANQGENCLLEMGLVRGLSIMPGDIKDAAEALDTCATSVADGVTVDTVDEDCELQPLNPHPTDGDDDASTGIPFRAYLLLITAVVALSSIGPLLNLQEGVDPVMKIYWRMSGTALFLFPLALRSLYQEGAPQLSIRQKFNFLVSVASYAVTCTAFVIALKYTTVGNATILANSQSLLLLVAKFVVGTPILFAEGGGAIVAFSGAALCSRDSVTASISGSNMTLHGDLLALVSAVAGVWYLVFAKTIRPHISLHIFMFLIMAIGSTLVLFSIMVLGIEHSFDRDSEHGIFGWMNLSSDRLPLEIIMVTVCNILGAMGYIRALHYFDNLVITVAALMEPIVAELTAAALGVGSLPGVLGWVGNVMVLVGTIGVVLPSLDTKSGASH